MDGWDRQTGRQGGREGGREAGRQAGRQLVIREYSVRQFTKGRSAFPAQTPLRAVQESWKKHTLIGFTLTEWVWWVL